ncbi:ATP-dependent DNA helicase RecG [Candidatus Saccharibacteria bacterium CG11_big_fil_rev_8_21_14_0_20_41_19]|nr:MAG: ATP-dependent DNA helicase RecG [Candidatus Saccharibacteria bacterium CG2_30_41_52]PIQ71017.1 MAG: ATP-dependent DNA helicase RecG [Candidatus Saccharibacteria bacterium CG11_big_fil_rev_8_21_14_0_20_41_19]PIZ59448.1 MAG: ATP-dependent DNA helicase RecG [Candidatus Saccharibacteria bacterium CG_4_10_14_0_2_um_filter_41_11]PJE66080.1 MAG: ATP-dependent DNA helicase RecG [Candidatus Saccharibacteria bacterium CG10_big_fil_rev_8_21_14_0_10_41_32]
MNLVSSLKKIKGVGLKTAEQFTLAGIRTVGDLIDFLPRTYEDFSHITTIANIAPGKATILARCEKIATRPVRRGLRITTATLVDSTGKLQAVWFNQPYRETQLKSGEEFYFSGEFEFNYNRYQLTNPSAELVKDMPVQTDRILPVYRSIKGLKTPLVRKILSELRPLITMLSETLPSNIIKDENLMSRSQAVLTMHFPEDMADIEKARDRLAFEELFQLLLASQLNRQENAKLTGWHIPFEQPVVANFVKQLPFELTGAQRRAAWEIIQDLERKTPMNRLLQGDVGSGKTVVAGLVACQVAHFGFQTAIMAPTEILASQHAETLSKLLQPLGVTVGLLTGSVKGTARKTLYEQIATGSVQVVVGTHALIQDSVNFYKLGFVVIDEQHRFGVNQRQLLLAKSEHMPHMLAMTATPIPRSLALTVYGELDISILNELPKGRKPIQTKIWSPNSRAQLYEKIDVELVAGRQAYVICSLIEENLENEIKSVQAEYKKLQNSVFKHRRIGLLHGKLKSDEKDVVMGQFSRGELDILVSTTVVEVGVDVPNATVVMIENADRFGLSQLHQLRGRVGRSVHQSYCYLVTSTSAKPTERLRHLEKSNDGFYLAEVDLKLRGPGEIYGRAQHGALNLQIATLADTKLIARAQKQAKSFVASGVDMLQYKQLATQVQYYQRLTTLN